MGPEALQERQEAGVGWPSEQGRVQGDEVRASGHTQEFKTILRAMGSHGRVHGGGGLVILASRENFPAWFSALSEG